MPILLLQHKKRVMMILIKQVMDLKRGRDAYKNSWFSF
jgi:hypothetical protein